MSNKKKGGNCENWLKLEILRGLFKNTQRIVEKNWKDAEAMGYFLFESREAF